MAAVPFQSLSSEEANKFFDSFDTVLTDCDGEFCEQQKQYCIFTFYSTKLSFAGVLWIVTKALPNSAEVMNEFQNKGKKLFYVTNNSTKTREDMVEKCRDMNFQATEDDILCTGNLAASYLQEMNFNKKVYVIGSEGIVIYFII